MSTATRGFASLPKEERRRIARLGGLASRGGGRPKRKVVDKENTSQTKSNTSPAR